MPRHKQLRISRETIESAARASIGDLAVQGRARGDRLRLPLPAAGGGARGGARGAAAAPRGALRASAASEARGRRHARPRRRDRVGPREGDVLLWRKLERPAARREDLVSEVPPRRRRRSSTTRSCLPRGTSTVPDVVAVRVVLDVPGVRPETPRPGASAASSGYHVLGAVQHLEDCEAVPRVGTTSPSRSPTATSRSTPPCCASPRTRSWRSRSAARHARGRRVRHGGALALQGRVARARRRGRDAARALRVGVRRRRRREGPRASAKPYALEWLNAIKDMQDIHSSREFVETIRRPRRRRISL